MACGTPVIGSDSGGIPTVINDNVSGFIVDRKVEELSNAILSISNDENRQTEMKLEARNDALDHSWDEVVHQVEKLYQECINKKDNY
jgi:glycosyltransferase involved in cell wall biosynthesis